MPVVTSGGDTLEYNARGWSRFFSLTPPEEYMTQDIEALRDKIDDMHGKLEDVSYYDLLEIDPELDDTVISKEATSAFRNLAKEWHVDRFDTDALGGDQYRAKLQEIFSTINTAHQVLTDEEKRTEYDMEISGENTDIGAILTAENAFRKGQNMLSTDAYEGAYQQFEIAYENNPDDIEYEAHFLYAKYMMIPKDEEGSPRRRSEAKEIYDQLDGILEQIPDRDWLLAFLGEVALGLKRYRDAQQLLNEALQYNPKNINAKRQKRIIEMRRKRQQNKGFFAKLMDKFRS